MHNVGGKVRVEEFTKNEQKGTRKWNWSKVLNFKCFVVLNGSYARQFGMISLSVLSLLIFFSHGFVKLQLWFFRAKNK